MAIDETELRLHWERAVGRDRSARRLFAAVLERHREPHRRYHGVRHVVWTARHVVDLAAREPVDDRDAIVVAAFLHDVVYRPAPGDDEAASAVFAERELTALGDPGWPPTRIARVAAMVRATDHAGDEPGGDRGGDTGADADTAVLLDADLAVLGAEPTRYQSYVNGVRAEYAHVEAPQWRAGRAAVLRRFLDRPHIYRTGTARDRWEARARANLAAELATLEA